MDITAIASAIADRFAAAAVTPPSGYVDPGTAVYRLPNAIASTPTAIVFPPTGEFSYAAGWRSGWLDFPVRWYIAPTDDLPRATERMYDWAGVLIDQTKAAYDLDVGPPVQDAVVRDITFGRLEYAGQEYTGIEMTVHVVINEAFQPTT